MRGLRSHVIRMPFAVLLGLGLGACQLVATPAIAARPDALTRLCNMGIRLALDGRTAAAESAFVAILTRSPGDARALNNLGNLAMWRHDGALAEAFYRAAADGDSADAGITLNGATSLLMAGDEDEARNVAEMGVRQAGGLDAAAHLLGLSPADSESATAGDPTLLRREQVLMLLRSAARAVPRNSPPRAFGAADSARARRPVLAWRTAGVRSSGAAEEPAVVYWKR